MADSRVHDRDEIVPASMLYVTCASVNEAEDIARTLVAERLVACANILGGMRSVYRWQGAVTEDDETVLILKTRSANVERVTERVIALHGYDVPCVVELPLARGNPTFLDWISTESQGTGA